MTRAVLIAMAAVAAGFPAVPAAMFAVAWLLWRSIPRDLRTIRDFDRARTGLARAHQRIGGGAE